jgi:hypothetical protein
VIFSHVPGAIHCLGFLQVFPSFIPGSDLSHKGFAPHRDALCPDSFASQASGSDGFDNSLPVNLGQGFSVAQTQEANKPVDFQ